jgi:hypothetical protein
VLEVDWQIVAQSPAINRYVGRLSFSFWKSRKGQRKQLVEGSIPFYLTRLRSGSKRMGRRLRQELNPELREALRDTFPFAGLDCDALTARVLATFLG